MMFIDSVLMISMQVYLNRNNGIKIVLDLVTQIHDVVFVNVYLGLGNPGGSAFWNEGYMGEGRKTGRSVYEQPGKEVDWILSQ
jgi:hypothetical protein